MADPAFGELAVGDKRDALALAATRGDHLAHLLEKDVWIVEVLKILIEAPFGAHLTFKGGTSLAKAWRAIRRFSEDIDITYDIRAFAPELVGDGEETLPPNRSQEQYWTKTIRRRLAEWVRDEAVSTVHAGLARDGFPATVRAKGERLYVAYDPAFEGYGFVRPEVMVDFGARSTGEPCQTRTVECDAAAFLPNISFPTARPLVMLAERTFWEKATAMHVFCVRQRGRGERLSRHWHDLVRLDDVGVAETAIADRALGLAVARHKGIFFREKDASGSWIDYEAAVAGDLRLVPEGPALDTLSNDYNDMLAYGVLLGDDEPFSTVMARCANIEEKANRLRTPGEGVG